MFISIQIPHSAAQRVGSLNQSPVVAPDQLPQSLLLFEFVLCRQPVTEEPLVEPML